MKKLALMLTILTATLTVGVNACDEQCLKEQAQTANKMTFSSYLTWSYCDEVRMEFMTSSMRSLQNYKEKNLNPKYKGGMRNTKKFIEQRSEWLKECDQYLSMTKKTRIFADDKTTEDIFSGMKSVSNELAGLIDGVKYSVSIGSDPGAVTKEKFETLFKLVDDHKTLMHLKGRYVFR